MAEFSTYILIQNIYKIMHSLISEKDRNITFGIENYIYRVHDQNDNDQVVIIYNGTWYD